MKYFIFLLIFWALTACGDSGSDVYGEDDSGDTDSSDTATSDTDSSDTDSSDTEEPYPWDVDCEEAECPQDPPPPHCNASGQLVTYSGPAACVDHVCQYRGSTSDCEYACVYDDNDYGFCKSHPCDGVVCDTPPDAQCAIAPLLTVRIGPTGSEYYESLGVGGINSHESSGYLLTFRSPGVCADSEGFGFSIRGEWESIAEGECAFIPNSPFTFCGDVNACIAVSGGPDYCDTEVHTPCQETGCWWLPTINNFSEALKGFASNSICVGEAEGFEPETELTYVSDREGTCGDDGYCEYDYTMVQCEYGCDESVGTCITSSGK